MSVIDEFGNASSLIVDGQTGYLQVDVKTSASSQREQKSLYFPSADGGLTFVNNGFTIDASTNGTQRNWVYFPGNIATDTATGTAYVEPERDFQGYDEINFTLTATKSGVEQNNVPQLSVVILGWNEEPTGFNSTYWRNASMIFDSSVEEISSGKKYGAFNMRKFSRISGSSSGWAGSPYNGTGSSNALYMWSASVPITHKYYAVVCGNESGDTTSGTINNLQCVVSGSG